MASSESVGRGRVVVRSAMVPFRSDRGETSDRGRKLVSSITFSLYPLFLRRIYTKGFVVSTKTFVDRTWAFVDVHLDDDQLVIDDDHTPRQSERSRGTWADGRRATLAPRSLDYARDDVPRLDCVIVITRTQTLRAVPA